MNNLLTLFKNWLATSSRKQKQTAALWGAGILFSLGLFALTGTSTSSTDTFDSSPFYFVGIIFKLIVVLLLIVASSMIFRRWLQPGYNGKKTRQLQLLETVRLTPKQALHLVSIGGQQLLIGATDQNISLLSPVETNSVNTAAEVKTVAPTNFASVLQTLNVSVSDVSTQ